MRARGLSGASSIRGLLLSTRGLLHALAADLKRGRKRPRGEQQSAGDMGGGVPGAPPEADTETASRCMQCAGTILAGCSEAEVAEMATDAWKALSGAAAMLAELGGETQEALLNLLSCLGTRSVFLCAVTRASMAKRSHSFL